MRSAVALIISVSAALLAVPASAQIGVGGVQIGVPDTPQVLDPVLEDTSRITERVERETAELAEARLRNIERLVRRNRSIIERDARGEPARRGVLLVTGADRAGIEAAEQAGFAIRESESLEALGMEIVQFSPPRGTSLADGERELRTMMPLAQVSADNLYFQAGGTRAPAVPPQAAGSAPPSNTVIIGVIDGAPSSGLGAMEIRGFAQGAGTPSDHGSAVVSLLRSAAGGRIKVADVYGTDPAGGNAMAITRAIAWLVNEGVDVITISLVGPDNFILARAVAAARRSGIVIVAAVGNDGPAAPPAYPASYEGAVAVTGVDRRERALIEAGRALHLDYAAPGADIYGMDRLGRSVRLRGTSYATPLVAARISQVLADGRNWRRALDAEAIDLGERGADDIYGRGLVCRGCGRR